MDQEIIDGLSTGVRDLVVWLNENGFSTCDSGDGTNHEDGMECAVPFPMIVMSLPDKYHMVDAAERLHHLMAERGVQFGAGPDDPRIEASYNPEDKGTVILLCNVLSKDVDLTGD